LIKDDYYKNLKVRRSQLNLSVLLWTDLTREKCGENTHTHGL